MSKSNSYYMDELQTAQDLNERLLEALKNLTSDIGMRDRNIGMGDFDKFYPAALAVIAEAEGR